MRSLAVCSCYAFWLRHNAYWVHITRTGYRTGREKEFPECIMCRSTSHSGCRPFRAAGDGSVGGGAHLSPLGPPPLASTWRSCLGGLGPTTPASQLLFSIKSSPIRERRICRPIRPPVISLLSERRSPSLLLVHTHAPSQSWSLQPNRKC